MHRPSHRLVKPRVRWMDRSLCGHLADEVPKELCHQPPISRMIPLGSLFIAMQSTHKQNLPSFLALHGTVKPGALFPSLAPALLGRKEKRKQEGQPMCIRGNWFPRRLLGVSLPEAPSGRVLVDSFFAFFFLFKIPESSQCPWNRKRLLHLISASLSLSADEAGLCTPFALAFASFSMSSL